MAQKVTDLYLWKALAETVTPLSEAEKQISSVMKKSLKSYKVSAKVVRCRAISSVLDLHGFTVQEAFEALEGFLNHHSQTKTAKVEVITGKGRSSQGLIKSEIFKWLDNPKIGQYIKEMTLSPDGGAVFITLKKRLHPEKKEV